MKKRSQNPNEMLADIFCFQIGNGDTAGVHQFPSIERLPRLSDDQRWPDCEYELGYALGLAYLKLSRPWDVKPGAAIAPDIAPDHLFELAKRLQPVGTSSKAAPVLVRAGFFAVIDLVVFLALRRPDSLQALAAKIDVVTNEGLKAYCLAALSSTGEKPSTFFDGLAGALDGR